MTQSTRQCYKYVIIILVTASWVCVCVCMYVCVNSFRRFLMWFIGSVHHKMYVFVCVCVVPSENAAYLSPPIGWGDSPEGQVDCTTSVSIVGGQRARQNSSVFGAKRSLQNTWNNKSLDENELKLWQIELWLQLVQSKIHRKNAT